MGEARTEVVIEGRTLSLSNLDKVLFPESGLTKAHVIDYYSRIAPVLLPHLRERPLTLKRYPDGIEGEHFYEKQCPSHRPDWVETTNVPSQRRGSIDFCVLGDLPSLVWAANLADLELHTYLHKAEDVQRPCFIAFDLDPGKPAGLLECCKVALQLRDLFAEWSLECFPKTSGSKGMQVYVPLNTPVTYEQTKPFARAVAEVMEREDPKRVTSNMSKAKRVGKVFIDWSQNDDHKTTVSVYSLRAKEPPHVSTPLRWREVEEAVRGEDASGLSCTPAEMVGRVDRVGDLFEPVLTLEQALPLLA